jgi:hypothetical protein
MPKNQFFHVVSGHAYTSVGGTCIYKPDLCRKPEKAAELAADQLIAFLSDYDCDTDVIKETDGVKVVKVDELEKEGLFDDSHLAKMGLDKDGNLPVDNLRAYILANRPTSLFAQVGDNYIDLDVSKVAPV